jgi:hypothetical protein
VDSGTTTCIREQNGYFSSSRSEFIHTGSPSCPKSIHLESGKDVTISAKKCIGRRIFLHSIIKLNGVKISTNHFYTRHSKWGKFNSDMEQNQISANAVPPSMSVINNLTLNKNNN